MYNLRSFKYFFYTFIAYMVMPLNRLIVKSRFIFFYRNHKKNKHTSEELKCNQRNRLFLTIFFMVRKY